VAGKRILSTTGFPQEVQQQKKGRNEKSLTKRTHLGKSTNTEGTLTFKRPQRRLARGCVPIFAISHQFADEVEVCLGPNPHGTQVAMEASFAGDRVKHDEAGRDAPDTVETDEGKWAMPTVNRRCSSKSNAIECRRFSRISLCSHVALDLCQTRALSSSSQSRRATPATRGGAST